ncbi:MAG: NMD3-related protein [Candidatus Nanohaloarchaea archaeon]
MELSKFCPRCGKEVDELYGDEKKLCADCYPDKYDLLEIPDVVEITVCSVCGRMRKKGEWIEEFTVQEQLAARFEEFAREDVEMELQFWEDNDKMFVRVHATKGDIETYYDAEVRFEQDQCPECSRFHGGFYKVEMQLRGEGDLERVTEEIAEKAAEMTNENRADFLSNVDKTGHGYDLYISTERMAKKILGMLRDRYDPEIKRSYELIGEEDGQEVYRNVISVRF